MFKCKNVYVAKNPSVYLYVRPKRTNVPCFPFKFFSTALNTRVKRPEASRGSVTEVNRMLNGNQSGKIFFFYLHLVEITLYTRFDNVTFSNAKKKENFHSNYLNLSNK